MIIIQKLLSVNRMFLFYTWFCVPKVNNILRALDFKEYWQIKNFSSRRYKIRNKIVHKIKIGLINLF